jgi:formamidopyrimidine-DNA glycosylase
MRCGATVPELPEVEMVARTLRRRLVGERVTQVEVSGKPLRRPIDAPALRRALVGAEVRAVERFGKYLLIQATSGFTVVGHLGMSGRLLFAEGPLQPHTHARFALASGGELRFVDPRRFGVLAVYAAGRARTSPELAALGVDPLDAAFTPAYLAAQLAATRREVKAFLLDQSRIAGLGNIYAAEALFRAGIAPRRRACRLRPQGVAALHAAVREVLAAGIRNRGTSFSDYVDADGREGENQHALWVYGREGQPCRTCGTRIRRLVQGARSTFHCPRCQR